MRGKILEYWETQEIIDNPLGIPGSTFSSMKALMTDFKLMVAQQSGKGPNLKVVKWW